MAKEIAHLSHTEAVGRKVIPSFLKQFIQISRQMSKIKSHYPGIKIVSESNKYWQEVNIALVVDNKLVLNTF